MDSKCSKFISLYGLHLKTPLKPVFSDALGSMLLKCHYYKLVSLIIRQLLEGSVPNSEMPKYNTSRNRSPLTI